MDRKIIMGVAAVAGIGLLLYMRKSGDQATIAGSGSLVGSGSAWANQPIVINTKAPVVADTVAKSPTPAPAPQPAAVPVPAPAYAQEDVFAVGGGVAKPATNTTPSSTNWFNMVSDGIHG